LIQTVQDVPGEVILKVNRTITDNGADVISFNRQTGQMTLWDNKATVGGEKNASGARAPLKINGSTTFNQERPLTKVLNDARDAIRNSSLSSAEQVRAMDSLKNGYRAVTRDSGNAQNSVIQKKP
jgi:hypothetical protein